MMMISVGRYFVLVALLQAWIIPQLVFSQQKCLGGFDIYFILDKSGSVSLQHFQNQTVDFVERTVENFDGKGVRFSFITFSSGAETVLELTGDRAKIKEGLNNLRKVKTIGTTLLSGALRMANDQVENQSRMQAAFSIFIILTDGKVFDMGAAYNQSKRAKEAGTIVYAIGVSNYQKTQLETLASKPSKDFVFTEPSYYALKNITSEISNRTCVEITSVVHKQACLGENNTVTLYGRGFEKFNSAESHSVWCGFKYNDTYRQVTKPSLVEDDRLVCPVPVLNDTKSVLMLQFSLNNGKTFLSNNVNISAKNCSSGERNRTENGTNINGSGTKPLEEIQKDKESGNSLMDLAFLGLLALLLLLALWWFLPLIKKKKPEESKPEPENLPVPSPSTEPQKPAPRAKWPTVEASYYGGGGAGGIAPVRVDWGKTRSTEAGARLNMAEPTVINDPVDPENAADVSKTGSKSSSSPGCWALIKAKFKAAINAVSAGYHCVASLRPQRGGNWLYSSNSKV